MNSYVSPATIGEVSASGRWKGFITQRPLPHDPDLQNLTPATRIRIAEWWLGQAATEARVANSFRVIHASLTRRGADPGLIRLSRRAIDDEHRHAALAEALAGLYAGRPVGPHHQLEPQLPSHPRARTANFRDALYVVGQCALNETFASAYLSEARRGAMSVTARFALRELLEDEIDHARIGWAFLHGIEPEEKRELSDWLVPLTISNLREWRNIVLPDTDDLKEHGFPAYSAAQDALTDALRGVLEPGFRHVGLDTRKLRKWIDRGAPVGRAGRIHSS